MNILNPFEKISVPEKYQKYMFVFILFLAAYIMYLLQHFLIQSFTLIANPMNSVDLNMNPAFTKFSKLVFYGIIFTTVFRYIVLLYEAVIFNYKREDGKVSASYIYFYVFTQIYHAILFLSLMYFIAYAVSFFTGFDATTLKTIISDEGYEIKKYANKIPTLINLPGAIAAIFIFLVWSFLMYASHYLGHSSRAYWLLAHRPHHIATALTNITHFIPEMKFLIGWIYVILQAFLIAAFSKLITQDQITVMYIFFAFAVFSQLIEIFNHATVTYEFIKNSKILRPIFRFFVCGPYHVLHHSSQKDYAMVNLGGICGIWDFVFGTFRELPDKEHNYGLTDQPDVILSANAIVFSGIQQMWYELKHNKDFSVRWKIIFGEIYYIPPVTKSFLINDENKFNVILHQTRD